MREPSERRRRVWQEEEDRDAPGGADCADDEEFVTPRSERAFDLTDTVASQATDSDTDTIEGVPCADPRWLLGSGIEHACE